MPRSGSTWQFNIIRSLFKKGEAYCAWVDEYDAGVSCPVHIIKAHGDAIEKLPGNSTVITGYRDLRAVAGSMVRMRWIVDDPRVLVDMCRNYVRDLNRVESLAARSSRYEDMLDHPAREATAIEAALGRAGKALQALAAVESMRPQSAQPTGTFTAYDTVSHLHAGHIGAKENADAIRYLSPASRSAIEEDMAPWLEERGYLSSPDDS